MVGDMVVGGQLPIEQFTAIIVSSSREADHDNSLHNDDDNIDYQYKSTQTAKGISNVMLALSLSSPPNFTNRMGASLLICLVGCFVSIKP